MSTDEHDRGALALALEQARAEGADRAGQIDAKLKAESWKDVAAFAAYCCQCRALHLKPWQEPPAIVSEDDPNERDKAVQQLLRRMLAAGVSRFAPDPIAAIAAAKQRKAVVS
jgi:hypothetical protein